MLSKIITLLIHFLIWFSKQPFGTSEQRNGVEAAEPRLVEIKATRNKIQVAAGDVVELECIGGAFSGQPEVKFISEFNAWNNSKVLSYHVAGGSETAAVRMIARTRLIPEQNQTIYCEATNGNLTVRDSINISVFPFKRHHFSSSLSSLRDSQNRSAAPRITFFYNVYLIMRGQDAILPCRVQSEEKYDITWLGSNKGVVSPLDSKRHEKKSNGDLVIKDVQRRDQSSITCVAKNKYAEGRIQMYFIVLDRLPITYTNGNVTLKEFVYNIIKKM